MHIISYNILCFKWSLYFFIFVFTCLCWVQGLGFLMKSFLSNGSSLAWSISILEILFEKSLIILAMSSIFSLAHFPDLEGPACSLKHLVSLVHVSNLAFSLPYAIMFDSILMASSYIPVRVGYLLSLKSREKSGLKAPTKVTLVAG